MKNKFTYRKDQASKETRFSLDTHSITKITTIAPFNAPKAWPLPLVIHAESKSFALFFQNQTQYDALLEAFAAITYIPSKPEPILYKPRPIPKPINSETVVISMTGESAKKDETKCINLEKCEKIVDKPTKVVEKVVEKCEQVLKPVCPNVETKVVKPKENILVEKELNMKLNKLEFVNLNEKPTMQVSTKSGKKMYSINVEQTPQLYEPKITNMVSQTCKAVKLPTDKLTNGQMSKKQLPIVKPAHITNLGEDLFISPDRQQKPVVGQVANKENMSSDWDEESNGKSKNKFDANDNWDD